MSCMNIFKRFALYSTFALALCVLGGIYVYGKTVPTVEPARPAARPFRDTESRETESALREAQASAPAGPAVKPPRPPDGLFKQARVAPVAEAKEETTAEDIRKLWKDKGFTPLSDVRFAYKDLKMTEGFGGYVTLIGSIGSVNPDDLQLVKFALDIYTPEKELVETKDVFIESLATGSVGSFKTLAKLDPSKNYRFSLRYISAIK